MKITKGTFLLFVVLATVFSFTTITHAALTLTAGSQVTTTPNVATSVTGFQIVGPATDTTPVKLRATNGTLSLSVIAGVTMSGNNSSTVSLSGTVENLNTALATLKYTRGSVGTDTLEVSLVNANEVFYTTNGHLYKFVAGSYSWTAAKAAAEGQNLYGAQGYLATITSSGENSFVYTRISGNGWLGTTDAETEKTWKWVTGPEAGLAYFQENPSGGGGSAISNRYNGWASGEPNDAGGEDCGYMYATQDGEWNDFPCGTGQGYVAEFGIEGALPTVVAANISVITADVPAITSLSPANSATLVSPTANLVLGFTKTVTAGTGNILIKKTSDNSTVATIDVTSGLVTGGGTNTITINPTDVLPEGTQLYVTVPGTAFKDSGDNFFEGIILSTTWTFTTTDVTAPLITDLAATPTNTSATIIWNTNEPASTKLFYSVDDSVATSTAETDTSSRVTSHSVVLSGLVACTTYSYKANSRDAFTNNAVSDIQAFTTTGCYASSDPTTVRVAPVDVTVPTTSTLQETGREFTVETPADFTTESSSVVIQIKSLPSAAVLTAIGKPEDKLLSAAAVVFDVTALIDSTTVLDSFDVPVTVSYKYTDADIIGLKESSLIMQHYANGAWSTLNDCAVDIAANTITCHAPHFSVFAIFGTRLSSGTTGASVQSRVNNLVAAGNITAADALKTQYPQSFAPTASPTVTSESGKKSCAADQLLTQNLKAGARNGKTNTFTKGVVSEVKILQAHMNRLGFKSGVVDGILGPITDGAIKRMQTYLGTKADGLVGPLTRALINNSCGEAGL